MRVEAMLAVEFWEAAMRRGRCVGCGYRGPHLAAHHAIPKSFIRRHARDAPVGVLWDVRNALCVCQEPAPGRCHERHHSRLRPLGVGVLPGSVFEFARELDARFGGGGEPFSAYLDGVYGEREAA